MNKKKEEAIGLFSYAGNYKIYTILGCILSGISSIFSLVPFICIWKVIEEAIRVLPNFGEAQNLSYYGWMATIFAILSILVYFLGLLCTHKAAFRIARNIKVTALHHILNLPLGYFSKEGSGKLRKIINDGAGQTESFLAHQLPDMTGAFLSPIVLIILLFIFDWRFGIISFIPIGISFIFMSKMAGNSLKGKMAEYQGALEDMNNEAVEYIRGVPVVKTFQQSIFSFKNFYESIMKYKKWVINYTVSLRLPMTSYTVCINGIFAFLIPAGILLMGTAVNYEKFLLSFIFYLLITPLITFMMNRILYSSENTMLAKDAIKRIQSILDEKTLKEPENSKKPNGTSIEFKDVTFTYKGNKKPAIEHISFKVKEGSTVAFVGPSGGGKTTIARLIPRFWDVDKGTIKIGGVDVKDIKTKDLMDNISFVFQETRLFKASILENIKGGKENASLQEINEAIKAARCEDIIKKMPRGIDTVIGGDGVYLSGGEAQRIALARAILKDAPIVLLDEATAFADPENEREIQLAFEELTKGKTVIMIAHRLSTIKSVDNIYVVKDGKIEEQGDHEQLISRMGLYNKMWNEYCSSIEWKVKNARKDEPLKEVVCGD